MSLHDDITANASNDLERAIVTYVFATEGAGLLDGYETMREGLFAMLVSGVRLYVASIIADEEHGGASLGSVAVDQQMLEDPSSFNKLEAARFRFWLGLSLDAIRENVEVQS